METDNPFFRASCTENRVCTILLDIKRHVKHDFTPARKILRGGKPRNTGAAVLENVDEELEGKNIYERYGGEGEQTGTFT